MTTTLGTIPILRVRGTLLVSIQTELRDTLADALQEDVLTTLSASGAQGLLIDISGLDIVDSYVARILAETGRMAAMMGAVTVVCGMRPYVALTLVRMGFRMDGVACALNVDDGLEVVEELLSNRRRKPEA